MYFNSFYANLFINRFLSYFFIFMPEYIALEVIGY